jgi:hypothetical protein
MLRGYHDEAQVLVARNNDPETTAVDGVEEIKDGEWQVVRSDSANNRPFYFNQKHLIWNIHSSSQD